MEQETRYYAHPDNPLGLPYSDGLGSNIQTLMNCEQRMIRPSEGYTFYPCLDTLYEKQVYSHKIVYIPAGATTLFEHCVFIDCYVFSDTGTYAHPRFYDCSYNNCVLIMSRIDATACYFNFSMLRASHVTMEDCTSNTLTIRGTRSIAITGGTTDRLSIHNALGQIVLGGNTQGKHLSLYHVELKRSELRFYQSSINGTGDVGIDLLQSVVIDGQSSLRLMDVRTWFHTTKVLDGGKISIDTDYEYPSVVRKALPFLFRSIKVSVCKKCKGSVYDGQPLCRSCSRLLDYSTPNNIEKPVAKHLPTFSFEYEIKDVRSDKWEDHKHAYASLIAYGFIPTSDATVAVELKSPVYGKVTQLRNLAPHLDTLKAHVVDGCGTHIHVGVSDILKKYLAHHIDMFLPLQRHMIARRDTAALWGRSFSTTSANKFPEHIQRQDDRTYWVNCMSRHNTLEWRLVKYKTWKQFSRILRFVREATRLLTQELVGLAPTRYYETPERHPRHDEISRMLVKLYDKHFPQHAKQQSELARIADSLR